MCIANFTSERQYAAYFAKLINWDCDFSVAQINVFYEHSQSQACNHHSEHLSTIPVGSFFRTLLKAVLSPVITDTEGRLIAFVENIAIKLFLWLSLTKWPHLVCNSIYL